MSAATVHSVQVKRRRDEDPMQALVVRQAKRKKVDRLSAEDVVFRLATTRAAPAHGKVLETSGSKEDHIFKLQRKRRRSSEEAPADHPPTSASVPQDATSASKELEPQLQSMISEYMRESFNKDGICDAVEDADPETEEYVWDVYYSEPAASGPLEGPHIGYIELEQGQDLLIFGSDSDDSDNHLVDDEDSNAEDFYQNDYPESDTSSSSILSLEERLGDLHVDTSSVVWSDSDDDM